MCLTRDLAMGRCDWLDLYFLQRTRATKTPAFEIASRLKTMEKARKKRVSVTFVRDEDVVQHIIHIEDKKSGLLFVSFLYIFYISSLSPVSV